ncbi:MAG TPA: DUF2339 domain-containing protein [Gaiellaceae bacterium]|nr:DUF2339 domain-containing protein [Gaiellaceae bacterium]
MEDRGPRIEALKERLATLERRTADELAAIRSELAELQGIEPAPATPAPAERPARRELDLSWLAGARGLALAGGAVTLLGIVFLFALAASRGWIGPTARCAIGASVSLLLLGAAVEVRRRFGAIAAALAAAGAGIGGLYVTLYAASRVYHLVGGEIVWIGVVAIAAVAVWFALAWESEMLASLGLVAVVLAPWMIDTDLNGVGLGASTIGAAVALAIGAQRRWNVLGGLAYGALFVQVADFVIETRRSGYFDGVAFQVTWPHRGTAALIAAAAFALALAGAVAYRRNADRLDILSTGLASLSVPLALLSVWVLLQSDTAEGAAFLVVGAAYAATAAAAWTLGRLRDLAELTTAYALLMVALATALFFSGGGLLVAWTLEGLALVLVGARLGRRGYQAAGLAYFGLAAAHLAFLETPVDHLFSEGPSPAAGVGSLLILAGAVLVAALALRGRPQVLPRLDLAGFVVAGLLTLYACSLGLLELAQHVGGGDPHAQFQRGQMLVSALWAIVALVLLSVGLVRDVPELRWGGLGLLGLALAKLFLFDLANLSSLTRAGSFLAVGFALLAGGFLVQRLARETPSARRRAGNDPTPATR